ncbi:MAG: type II toxin-antitoxin system RelE/ParE family toxin [Euryarchaeota archaeon]|nr:type II toxin-antitoxin system RelE/ParE family toxin [Euryarchaeota archaeon]
MTKPPYDMEVVDKLRKDIEQLERRDKIVYNAIIKRMLRIAEDPYLGKPLKGVLKGKRRVHVGHFVLIYEIDENEHKVIFLEFAHHDEAYKRT